MMQPPNSFDARPVKTFVRDRLPVWHAIGGIVLGGITAQGGAGVAMILVLLLTSGLSSPQDLQNMGKSAMTLPVAATAIVAVGAIMVAFAIGVPWLAKVPLKRAWGLYAAPSSVYFLAPLGALALGPTSDGCMRIARYLAPNLTFDAVGQLTALMTEHSFFALWPFIALIPGVAEEVFFRGMFQRAFGRGTKAVIISGLCFAAYHVDPHHVAGVIPVGLYAAWLAARTGSIFVPICAHVANNTAALLAVKATPAEELAKAADTPMPLYVIFIGWGVAFVIIHRIWKVTKPLSETIVPSGGA